MDAAEIPIVEAYPPSSHSLNLIWCLTHFLNWWHFQHFSKARSQFLMVVIQFLMVPIAVWSSTVCLPAFFCPRWCCWSRLVVSKAAAPLPRSAKAQGRRLGGSGAYEGLRFTDPNGNFVNTLGEDGTWLRFLMDLSSLEIVKIDIYHASDGVHPTTWSLHPKNWRGNSAKTHRRLPVHCLIPDECQGSGPWIPWIIIRMTARSIKKSLKTHDCGRWIYKGFHGHGGTRKNRWFICFFFHGKPI